MVPINMHMYTIHRSIFVACECGFFYEFLPMFFCFVSDKFRLAYIDVRNQFDNIRNRTLVATAVFGRTELVGFFVAVKMNISRIECGKINGRFDVYVCCVCVF